MSRIAVILCINPYILKNVITWQSINEGLTIKNPEDYGLPYFTKNTNYIIAKNQNFFVFKTDYNNYVNKLKNTFQHGGISMEELLIPLIKLTHR